MSKSAIAEQSAPTAAREFTALPQTVEQQTAGVDPQFQHIPRLSAPKVFLEALPLIEFILAAGAVLAVSLTVTLTTGGLDAFRPLGTGLMALSLAGSITIMGAVRRVYQRRRLGRRRKQAGALVAASIPAGIGVLAIVLVSIMNPWELSRVAVTVMAAFGVVFFWRMLLAALSRGSARFRQWLAPKVVLVGDAAAADPYVAEVVRQDPDAVVLDVFSATQGFGGGYPHIADLNALARRRRIDRVVIMERTGGDDKVTEVLNALAGVPAELKVMSLRAAESGGAGFLNSLAVDEKIESRSVLYSRRDHGFGGLMKSAFDRCAAASALIFFAPVFIGIAILIKMETPGPVFFKQRRGGFNQSVFYIFKFRTMTTLDDGDTVRQATANDKRVTKIGGFLRKTSLDELPQLINVVRGEMALVGPRPHALAHNREYEPQIFRFRARHNVTPGITGWAQVNGLRGETDTPDKMRRRVEHDQWYCENWSLGLDIAILLRTVVTVLLRTNAY